MAFTIEQREEVIRQIEAGRSVTEACKAVGIAQRTFRAWVKEGKQLTDGSEKAIFASRYEVAKIRQSQQGLSHEDLVRLLEAAARDGGSVRAIELLLMRPWERKTQDTPEKPKTLADELAARRNAKGQP